MLGDDAGLLSHEGPLPSGSNAWAVGGARTVSGFPLVAGDPHRTIESPGVYQQIRLACDEFDVVGFAFPGVPGVPHFAHAGDVAWAITNAMADYQDVYAERLRREGGRVEALGPAGWEPVTAEVELIPVLGEPEPREVEVVVTATGGRCSPVASTRGRGSACAPPPRSWATWASTRSSRCCARAPSTTWTRPSTAGSSRSTTWSTADRHGAVRYRVAGRIPTRDDRNRARHRRRRGPGGRLDRLARPLPRADVPADGQVVTANERRGPESEPIGTTFAPPHRARSPARPDGRP